MIKSFLTTAMLALLMASNGASAQVAPAPAAPNVQSVNIADVGPDLKLDSTLSPTQGHQLGNVAPSSAANSALWSRVGQGTPGYSSLPSSQAPEAGVLIQPTVQYPGSRLTNAGEAWRQVRNQWLIPYGMAFVFIALLACVLFHFGVGKLGQEYPQTGLVIERFTPVERAAHWTNAVAFVLLAVSGMTMAFGKTLLLPILGTALFGWLSYALKNVHNFVGPLFAVSLVVMVVIFIKDNLMKAADWVWIKKMGGVFGEEHPASHRFNAGEKGMFWWGMTLPGIAVVGTGLVLDKLIPGFGELRGQMQISHMLHLTGALWMIALICGHIYMGMVAVPGAYEGLKTGYVPEAWAKEHHALWLDDVVAGKIPAQRSATNFHTDSSGVGSDIKTPITALSA